MVGVERERGMSGAREREGCGQISPFLFYFLSGRLSQIRRGIEFFL